MATGYFLLDNPQHPNYPQCGYPRRKSARASGTIILHDAEGGTDLVGADMGAENVARFIRTRSSFGSYHRLVDRDTRIKLAPIDYETWHSVPDNPWSVGICVAWNKADLARMTYVERRSYYVPLALEVLDVRAEFAERGITVPIGRMLTAAETQARRPGISTHSRTDPSRRSDPFGTDSKYEREFLAVLAELATKPTTPPEEPDMDKEDKDRAARIEKMLEDLHTGVAPQIPVSATKDPETINARAALRDIRLGVTRQIDDAVARGVATALADVTGVDKDAITEGVVAEVNKALKREYVLTPKENTP